MPKAPRLTAEDAEAMLLKAGFVWLRSKGSHRIYASLVVRAVTLLMHLPGVFDLLADELALGSEPDASPPWCVGWPDQT